MCWSAVFLVLGLVASACGGGDGGGESQPSPDVETTETAAPAEPVDSGEETPAPTGTEPDDTEEPLVAPVDTTTTTTPSDDGEAVAAAPAESEPQSGGTLRVGLEAESDGLNPAANNFAVSAYIMTYPIFDPLAYFDKQGNWVPVLAESWTKIDDYTVEYRGVRPSARLPIGFASQLGMILPSEWLERALQDQTLNQMPVGTGPFMIESRVQDEVTVLARNPDYWAADTVDTYLDRIEIRPITDEAVAAERLIAGELDLLVTVNTDATLTHPRGPLGTRGGPGGLPARPHVQ